MQDKEPVQANDTQTTDKEASILIPKIDVSEPPQETSDEVHQKETKEEGTAKKKFSPFSKLKFNTEFNTEKKWKKPLFIFLGVLGVFLLYNLIAGFIVYKKATRLISQASSYSEVVKSQDLSQIKSSVGTLKGDLNSFANTYKLISWERFLPFVGNYISDGRHAIRAGQAGLDAGELVLEVIEPYSDLLGFTNSAGGDVLAATSGEETAEDRIDFIVKTIPELTSKIDPISEKVKIIQDEISQINPDRYPVNLKGKVVRANIKKVIDLVDQASSFLVTGKPFLESASYLLGVDEPRTYLVLFQNDKELRPTGGFMTAYAILKVDQAKVSTVVSSDIYSLDAIYKPSIKAPEPIIDYIKGPYVLSQNWRLRDMNWSPDFAESMATFLPAAEEAGISQIDGVIAVDTQVLVNILDVIGPIGVPGFGNFSTEIDPECNCAQVIHELEAFADVEGPIVWDPVSGEIVYRPKNSDNRKKIIGPLMNSILANAMGQPKEKIPGLMEAAYKSFIEKHVLFYILDENVEKAVSDFGLGGAIREYDGDYLHINDANLGGRKSNLYAYETVEQDIEVSGSGEVTKTVTITYQNPEKQDGWLNSVLPTWVRVYVPKGSQLVAAEGLEAKADPYEDLGKTVFSGFFQLRPEGVSKVTFKYTLPFKVSKDYKLLIQKQPGTDGFLYTINLGKHMEEFKLTTDKEIKIEI